MNSEKKRACFTFYVLPKSPDDAHLKDKISKLVSPDAAALILETYRKYLYPQRQAYNEEILIAVESDLNFRLPVINLLESHCPNATSTFAYLFNWQSPALESKLGACHAMEIGFVFGNYNAGFCGSGPVADKLSRQMQSAWAAFANCGNPTCPQIGNWSSYCQDRNTLILGSQTHLEISPSGRNPKNVDPLAFRFLKHSPSIFLQNTTFSRARWHLVGFLFSFKYDANHS